MWHFIITLFILFGVSWYAFDWSLQIWVYLKIIHILQTKVSVNYPWTLIKLLNRRNRIELCLTLLMIRLIMLHWLLQSSFLHAITCQFLRYRFDEKLNGSNLVIDGGILLKYGKWFIDDIDLLLDIIVILWYYFYIFDELIDIDVLLHTGWRHFLVYWTPAHRILHGVFGDNMTLFR